MGLNLTQVTEYFDTEEEIRFAKEQIEKYGDIAVLRRERFQDGTYTQKVAYFKRGVL